MTCEVCQANPTTDNTVVLHRVNTLGEKGRWRCQKHYLGPIHHDIKEITEAILEDNRKKGSL